MTIVVMRRKANTIITLHYDILWRQFEIGFVFKVVAEVLDAMAIEYEEAVERRLRTVTEG
jgi:hypothetical protein